MTTLLLCRSRRGSSDPTESVCKETHLCVVQPKGNITKYCRVSIKYQMMSDFICVAMFAVAE